MNSKQDIGKAVIAWLAVGVLFIGVRPDHLPVLLLILPFVLLYWAFYRSGVLIVRLIRHVQGKKVALDARPNNSAAAVSGFLVLLLVVQSLGQLGPRDLVTFGLIFLISCFYIARWRRKKIL